MFKTARHIRCRYALPVWKHLRTSLLVVGAALLVTGCLQTSFSDGSSDEEIQSALLPTCTFDPIDEDNVKANCRWGLTAKDRAVLKRFAQFKVYRHSNTSGLDSSLVDITPNTTYSWDMPITSSAYLMVRGIYRSAKKGETSNSNYAAVVPDGVQGRSPPDYGHTSVKPGIRKAIPAGDRAWELMWERCPELNKKGQPQTCVYWVYEITGDSRTDWKTPIGSTLDTHMIVRKDAGKCTQTPCHFGVRASLTSSGLKETNTTYLGGYLLKRNVPRPIHTGLTDLQVEPGRKGLRELTLEWQVAEGAVTGYALFQGKQPDMPDSSLELVSGSEPPAFTYGRINPDPADPNIASSATAGSYIKAVDSNGKAVTQTTIRNLDPDTQYYFVVRPFYLLGTTMFWSESRLFIGRRTLKEEPLVGWAGIDEATTATGLDGFDTVTVTWPVPNYTLATVRGVYNIFRIDYELGRCGPGNTSPAGAFASAQSQDALESDTSATVNGLANRSWYRFRVRAVYNLNGKNFEDANTRCDEAYTEPEGPKALGIASTQTVTSPGVNGWDRRIINWYGLTRGSFTRWVVEAEPKIPGDGDTPLPKVITNVNTLSTQIDGLSPGKDYKVRVRAEFVCPPPKCDPQQILPDINTCKTAGVADADNEACAGAYRWVEFKSRPIQPTGEGVKAVTVVKEDQLKIEIQKPSNESELPYITHYIGWRRNDTTAADNAAKTMTGWDFLISKADVDANPTFIDPNLTPDTRYCYSFRAIGMQDPYPKNLSLSTTASKCALPQIEAPASFSGVTKVRRPATTEGFTQVEVEWTPIDKNSDDYNKFTHYEIAWHPTDAKQIRFCEDKGVTCTSEETQRWYTIFNKGLGFKVIGADPGKSAIPEGAQIRVQVRATNKVSGVLKYNDGGQTLLSTAYPKEPQGDGLTKVSAVGKDSIGVTYNVPCKQINNDTCGLWSHVLLLVQAGAVDDKTMSDGYEARKLNAPYPSGRSVIALKYPPTHPERVNNGKDDTNVLDVTLSSSDLKHTFGAAPTAPQLLAIPRDLFPSGGTYEIRLSGLNAGQKVGVLGRTVNLESNFPSATNATSHFLQSSFTTPQYATPEAAAPPFPYAPGTDPRNGIKTLGDFDWNMEKADDANAFNWIKVTVPAVTTSCDGITIQISVKEKQDDVDRVANNEHVDDSKGFWDPSSQIGAGAGFVSFDCANVEQTKILKTGPVAHKEYHVRARAKLQAGPSTFFYSGINKPGYIYMAPEKATGDQLNTVVHNDSAATTICNGTTVTTDCYDSSLGARTTGSLYKAKLTWTLPTNSPTASHIYVWKANHSSSVTAATTAVVNASKMRSDKLGPTNGLNVSFSSGGPMALSKTATTYTDTSVLAGVTCYLIKSVYHQDLGAAGPTAGDLYQASDNEVVKCINIPYDPLPGIADQGVVAVDTSGTCADGAAKIRLQLKTMPAGTSVEQYHVYLSRTAPANGTYAAINTAFNLSGTADMVITRGDPVYDPVTTDDYIFYGCNGRVLGGNTYYYVKYALPAAPPTDDKNTNFASYDLPNSQANYAHIPSDVSGIHEYFIAVNEASVDDPKGLVAGDTLAANLTKCNADFHDFSVTGGGLPDSDCGSVFKTTAKALSAKGVEPATATWAQAWTACRNASTDKLRVRLATEEEWRRAARWASDKGSTLESVYQTDCNTAGTKLRNTGADNDCRNFLGLADTAGNAREWVDHRIEAGSPSSLGYFTPSINFGQSIANGIDNVIRRYYDLVPGAENMALLLGSGFDRGGTYPNSIDAETERWQSTTSATSDSGFRCVAFSYQTPRPTPQKLLLPREPVYVSADLPSGTPTSPRTKPTNRFLGDVKPEGVTISTSAKTVTLTWNKWLKDEGDFNSICDQCSYEVYRLIWPTAQMVSTSVTWTLAGGPYTSIVPLDPLAVTSSSTRTYSPIATVLNTDCGTSECTYTDTHGTNGFDRMKLYVYFVVAKDGDGNLMPPRVQRYRSPYYTGNGAPSFRTELRGRRAGVFLVDESLQSNPGTGEAAQVMVYVPMHQSGIDHDFFIHKYEASLDTGSQVLSNSTTAANPLGANSNSITWKSLAGSCHDRLLRGTRDFAGDCATTNRSAGDVQSRNDGTAVPLNAVDRGAMWRACHNSSFLDGSGNRYHLYLPTSTEWGRAAEWGDMNHDRIIDIHVDYAALLAKSGPTSNHLDITYLTTNKCNAGNGTLGKSGATPDCRSRYGMESAVGNVWEWTIDSAFRDNATGDVTAVPNSITGLDNGIDGMWLAESLKETENHWEGGNTNSLPLVIDINRAFARVAKVGWSVFSAVNPRYTPATTGTLGVIYGSGYPNPSENADPYAMYLPTPATTFSEAGGRCAF